MNRIYVVEYGNDGVCGEGYSSDWSVYTSRYKAVRFCKQLIKGKKHKPVERMNIYTLYETDDKGCWDYISYPSKNYADDFIPPPKTKEELEASEKWRNSPMGKRTIKLFTDMMKQVEKSIILRKSFRLKTGGITLHTIPNKDE